MVSAAGILQVVYRRGCDVIIPPPPLDTYLVKGCPSAWTSGGVNQNKLPWIELIVYIYSRELIYSAQFLWDFNLLRRPRSE